MRFLESSKLSQKPEVYEGITTSESWMLKEPYLETLISKWPKDARILDIGCGNGAFLSRLKAAGYTNVHGTDIANFLADKSIPHSAIDMNVAKLPYESESFDVVTAFQVFEHFENYFLPEQEVARILRKGGTFIFSVPNPYNIFYKIKFVFTDNITGWNLENNHLLFLTKDVFKKTFLKDFELVGTYFRRGPVPMLGRLNIIPGVHLPARTRLLPRTKALSDRICYILSKR